MCKDGLLGLYPSKNISLLIYQKLAASMVIEKGTIDHQSTTLMKPNFAKKPLQYNFHCSFFLYTFC